MLSHDEFLLYYSAAVCRSFERRAVAVSLDIRLLPVVLYSTISSTCFSFYVSLR